MTETAWDTDTVSSIIANDEYLYNTAMRLARSAYSIGRLAQRMEEELTECVDTYPYCDVDMNQVDWHEIATEYIEEEVLIS